MLKKLGSVVVALTIVFTLAACSSLQKADAANTYVSVDINPSIEFIVDEDDIVLSFNLLNEDAQILCADVDFVGMTIEDATELFVQLATEAGYIDVDSEDNAVLITVIGDEESDLPEQIQERIRLRVMGYMARNSINAQIFTEDFTQSDLIAQANELGISPGKLKLILLAQVTNPELTIEEGITTPVKDLMSSVQEAHKAQMGSMTQAEKAEFVQQRTQLMTQFQTKLQEHLNANPALSDEEVEAIMNKVQNTIRTTTRTQWQETADLWQQRIQERFENSENGNSSNGNK